MITSDHNVKNQVLFSCMQTESLQLRTVSSASRLVFVHTFSGFQELHTRLTPRLISYVLFSSLSSMFSSVCFLLQGFFELFPTVRSSLVVD